MPPVTARACANIALVKYWGKRDAALNLPATGSLSLTLDALCDVAKKLGAYGAKLTGAGGGGSVIAIAPRDKEAEILAAWKTASVHGFVATLSSR